MAEQISMAFMAQYKKEIEQYMTEQFERDSRLFPAEIKDAMAYSLFAGGKRLRPILCLCAEEAIAGKIEYAYQAGYALEMIHTYSLIHDDLPGMDNDDLRRGKPTNHKMFGEALAILAGDGLLTLAFEVLCAYKADIALELIKIMSKSAGSQGMVAGQVKDILAEEKGLELTKDEMEYIHRHKTGDLITAALLMGGMIAGATKEELTALKVYGDHFGLAFQITDDILDVIGKEEKIGKPVGSDAKNDKVTYVTLYGVEGAQQMAYEEVEQAKNALQNLKGNTKNLTALADFLLTRES